MPNHYRQIPISAAASGMVLSDAVLDTKGYVLVPKGTVLTTAMLKALDRHEIEVIAVVCEGDLTENDQVEHIQLCLRVEQLFRKPSAVSKSISLVSDTNTSLSCESSLTATDVLHRYILNFRSKDLP
jgi:hypothetical protein